MEEKDRKLLSTHLASNRLQCRTRQPISIRYNSAIEKWQRTSAKFRQFATTTSGFFSTHQQLTLLHWALCCLRRSGQSTLQLWSNCLLFMQVGSAAICIHNSQILYQQKNFLWHHGSSKFMLAHERVPWGQTLLNPSKVSLKLGCYLMIGSLV